MSNFRQLRVWHAANQQIIGVAGIAVPFGDLMTQLRRAAISVSSNIAEGSGRGNDSEYVNFLRIARASNDELAAQLHICAALGAEVAGVLRQNDGIGRMLTVLIRRLGSGQHAILARVQIPRLRARAQRELISPTGLTEGGGALTTSDT